MFQAFLQNVGSETNDMMQVGIVGCGGISHQHLVALAKVPGVTVVGVVDRSAAAARFCQQRFQASHAFTDLSDLLALRPSVVHVLTPPPSHASIIAACLNAGAHVLCEKPLAESRHDVDGLLEKASAAGRVLIESQNYRFNDQVIRLQRLIEEGALGDVREVEISVNLDLTAGPMGDPNLSDARGGLRGGAVHDMLPHLAYLFLTFAAWRPVDRVQGRLVSTTGNARARTDTLEALVGAGPVRGRLFIRPDVKPDAFKITVAGSRGTAETDLFQPFLRLQGGANVGKRAPLEQVLSGAALIGAGLVNLKNKVMQYTPYHGLHRMIAVFYADLASGAAQPITPAQVSASAALVDRLIDLGGVR